MKFLLLCLLLLSQLSWSQCPSSSPASFPTYPSTFFKVILVPGAGSENEDLYLGHIPYGKYFAVYTEELNRLKIPFVVLPSSPTGNENIETRTRKLKSLLNKEKKPVLLIGHSLGGLVARLVQRDPKTTEKIAATVTITTPHLGTPIADWLLTGKHLPKAANLISKAFGFDINDKEYLAELTVENNSRWNNSKDRAPHIKNIFSVVGAQSPKELTTSNPLLALGDQVLRRTTGIEGERESDGLIPRQSQVWGECLFFTRKNHGSIVGKDLFRTPSKDILPRVLKELDQLEISFRN